MKVIVIGAGGRLGSRIVENAVAAGHDVTAYVRDPEKLRRSSGIAPAALALVRVVQGDAADAAALRAAMRGHCAAVQAAGYIGETYAAGAPLARLVASAVAAAAEGLEAPRRLWVLAGAGVLDVPGRPGLMLLDVPGTPRKYLVHRDNLALLRREGAALDWSLACPGAMYDAPAGRTPPGAAHPPARAVVDEAPLRLPGWAACLPAALLLPALAAAPRQLRSASYEEVAAAIVDHLDGGGPLRHKRVGFVGGGGCGGGAP
ncbi:MAG: hypothetical protein J3K34DRAFT_404255 [Monoraphidium minutum]|nr:MAG: hypothetical protein J3K34DRAFT_404255 [Monoraphidium minutum]